MYQDDKVTAYWDVPVFAEHLQVRANRVKARFVDRENKEVMLIEMSFPWMDNRKQERRGEDLKVHVFATRAQETVPRVQHSTMQHRH